MFFHQRRTTTTMTSSSAKQPKKKKTLLGEEELFGSWSSMNRSIGGGASTLLVRHYKCLVVSKRVFRIDPGFVYLLFFFAAFSKVS